MTGTLTTDQRWLLFAIGGWTMRDCLLGPAGTDHLMQSMYSSCGGSGPDGGPEWLTGWNTRAGKITAPAFGDVRVVVTTAQINAYARTLPGSIRDDLMACGGAARAAQRRTDGWCHCPWLHTAPNAHSGPCHRYHPSADEDIQHLAAQRAIDAWQDRVLRRALELDAGQQLTLFDGLA
jgi:hypothetical protein